MGLGKFIKARYEKLKEKKKSKSWNYRKVDPTNSMRVEARSKLARKIIQETLKAADSPGKIALSV